MILIKLQSGSVFECCIKNNIIFRSYVEVISELHADKTVNLTYQSAKLADDSADIILLVVVITDFPKDYMLNHVNFFLLLRFG